MEYSNGKLNNTAIVKFNRFNNRNIISLKKLIFPQIDDQKVHQLMIDDESIKYITFSSCAQEITNIIMNSLSDFPCPMEPTGSCSPPECVNSALVIVDSSGIPPDCASKDPSKAQKKWESKSLATRMKHLVITEMTAGVGGNVLNFAKYFKYINAIEIDTRRYNYLNNNIDLYGYDNVNCYNDNSLHILIEKDDIVQDIIFFDPPWGGKDYKLFSNLRLQFGEYSIENVCRILLQRKYNKMIVLKLPNNYDLNYFCDELKEYKVSSFILERMTIIVIKNYN